MDGAIHAPVIGRGHGPSPIAVAPVGVAIGIIVGVALAWSLNAIADTEQGKIGPFSAPGEICRFSTFNSSDLVHVSAPQQAVPAMVSKCDYLFKEPQSIPVGYRI